MELTTKRLAASKGKSQLNLFTAAIMIGASFLISRVCFMEQMFPAAVAFATALISFHALNLYLLPFMLLGIATFYSSGISIWADAAALCACALVYLCTARIQLASWHRALISGSITIICRSVYYIAAELTYRISTADLLLEGCLVAALCGIFDLFFQMIEKETPRSGLAGGLLALSTVILLLVSGTGISWLVLPAAMTITLFVGYLLGAVEGLFAAAASGFFMLLCGGAPGTILVLALGGMTAGFFKGQNKITAALCFAASVMGIGMFQFSISMDVPYYGPLSAAGLLILLPGKWVLRLDTALSTFLRSDSYEEKQRGADAACQLEELRNTFDDLAALFVSQDNRRILMSYQFKAMSRVFDHTIKAVSCRPSVAAEKYQVETAWAGYARNQGISGDSYMWADLPGGRFAIVLSDGMGKGRIAAEESSLAVTTAIRLLETGLEVEMVLRLLNEIMLLNAEKEVFSTIDLGIFNKRSGKMKFYKIGAATTFIKRRDSVEMLTVSAMPMGIVDGLKMDYVTASLNPGDQVIMISDGVTDSRREDFAMKWLKNTISGIKSKDPQTMCDLIMNQAVQNYGLKEKDDLTVLAMRVD